MASVKKGTLMFSDAEIKNINWVKATLTAKFKFIVNPTPDNFCTEWRKYNPWIDHIHWQHTFLSGGAIVSLFHGDTPKDWDIYFTEEPVYVRETLINSYQSRIADVDKEYRTVMGENGKMITENAITMKGGYSFIFKHYGKPKEVKKTFDYVHCTPHYDIWNDTLYISRHQYDACVNKTLIVNNQENVTSWRENKFKKRGYTPWVL